MNIRQVAFHDFRNVTFVCLIATLSAFALITTSTITPILFTLSGLHVYARFLFPSDFVKPTLSLWTALTFAGIAPNLHASLDALSTPGMSIVLLLCVSAITSATVLGAVYIDWRVSSRMSSPWSQVALFPAIWASVWCTISYLSPAGHLLTWSRANSSDAYNWIIPIFGTSSQDWIAAAWAVVLSEAFGTWFIGSGNEGESLIQQDQQSTSRPKQPSRQACVQTLASLLILLTIPSFLISNLPLPVAAVETATPFGVGCILPPYHRYKHHSLTLVDFIDESKKYQNSAKFLLWPEGAVTFNSVAEREAGFEQVRANITGCYVGVSFEQLEADPTDTSGRKSRKRTGVAVISKDSKEPHLLYYKRHLVPVVESYHLSHSIAAPELYRAEIPRPKDVSPSKWAPGPNHTRLLPLTASICLDFATPAPFSDLEARPGLILAPARTWDVSIGQAMWLQAKERASELNSMLLWCDGGDGGVSGIAGGGFNEFIQVGLGSWVKTIATQYPFDERRTFYARWGDAALLLYWFLIFGPSVTNHLTFSKINVRGCLGFVGIKRKANLNVEQSRQDDESPNLVDL